MMTDEILEKVAEEILQAESLRALGRPRKETWGEQSEDCKNQYRPLAQAAIDAMPKARRAKIMEFEDLYMNCPDCGTQHKPAHMAGLDPVICVCGRNVYSQGKFASEVFVEYWPKNWREEELTK